MNSGTINLVTDGSCKGNPGPGGIGITIYDDSFNLIAAFSEPIGNTTCNQAEYKAVIRGLKECAKYTTGRVNVFCDSELVVLQINRAYRIKADHLLTLFLEIRDIERVFKEVIYQHVKRENKYIQRADQLATGACSGI